ncbi:MAG: ABC transporter substrate-binding protein [Burkholderiales bacterium]|nr:ABC transporter substrate-binding protein [Burkholderiales bacterium]
MKKLLTILAIAFSINAFAEDTTIAVNAKDCSDNTPCAVIKSSANMLSQALNGDASQKQTLSLIQNSIVPQIDFTMITRRVLGQNVKSATPEQLTQVTSLFKQLLVNTYSTALSKFKGATVVIASSTIDNSKPYMGVVTSTVTMPHNDKAQPINVEYDLTNKTSNNTWKIYDVKIENVSITTTYRSQFNDIIQKSGIDGLIEQLKTKVNNNKK